MARMVNCCCCIPLKGGVVIITILWLLYGTYTTVSDALSLGSGTNDDKDFNGIVIPRMIIYGLVATGAAFGLFVLACANTSKMLFIYSKIAYGIAAVELVNGIAGLITIIMNKNVIMETCSSYYSQDSCNQGYYNRVLTFFILMTLSSILISVYFAMVVSAYAHKRKSKEVAVRALSGEINGDIPSSSSSYDKIEKTNHDLKK